MGLGVYRNRIYGRGLANCFVREREPSEASVQTSIGLLKEVTILDSTDDIDVIGDNGIQLNSIQVGNKAGAKLILQQSSKEEFDFMRSCRSKVYAIQYFGFLNELLTDFQYWCWELCKLRSPMDVPFNNTPRTLPLNVVALENDDVVYPIPLYHTVQLDRELSVEFMRLFMAFYDGANQGTAYPLDVSGFSRHGLLNSDYASIWQDSGTYKFLRFDGTNDYCSLADVLDDDGASDFMIEGWIRIPAANGTAQEIMSKRADDTANSTGYRINRKTDNTLEVRFDDGDTIVNVVSTGTILQNVITHFAVTVDRNGNAQIYLNGAASGSAVSVAALTTLANSANYYLGRLGTGYGQVDYLAARHHIYGAGLLPSNIATVISNHYNGEKAKFGL